MSVREERKPAGGFSYGLTFALLVVALFCFFGPAFARGDFYFSRDLTAYHFPMKAMIRQVVDRGGFPYWNPAQGGGEPMAANPAYEMFYPPQWLILVGPFYLGYRLHILIHVLIAAAGMFFLLRQLRLQPLSCLAGSLAFALGGPYLSLIRLLPFLFAVSWMPWIFYFFLRYCEDRRGRWFVAVALSLAMQALVGEPIMAGETWLLLGACAWWRGEEAGERRTLLFRAAFLIALAVGIAAVQLLPGIDHARDSVRSRGFSWPMVSTWSLPPERPLEMLFPAIFRHRTDIQGRSMMSSMYPDGDPFVQDWYSGLPLILGAIALAFRKRRSGLLPAASMLGLFYLLAIGRHSPLLRWLYESGVLHWLRFMEKFWLPGSFILICAGAMALDQLFLGDRAIRKSLLTLTSLWLAVTLWLVARGGLDDSYRWQLPARGVVLLILLLAFPVSAGGKRGSAARRQTGPLQGWRTLMASAVVVFFFLDCGYLRRELLPVMPRQFFSPPPADLQLPAIHDFRLFHQADWEWEQGSPRATSFFVADETYFWSFRNGEFPRQPWAWGHFVALQQDIDGTSLIPSADLLTAMFAVRNRGRTDWADIFMAMSNVGYRAVLRPFVEESERVKGDLRKASPVDFIPTEKFPRYYFAEQLIRVASRDEFVSKLTSGTWGRRAAFVSFEPFLPAPGRVLSTAATDSTAALDVDCDGHSYLVISMTPHKYWMALVDGRDSPLVVTNVGYQGLSLSGGRHHIEMRYRNPLIAVGAVISALALLMLILTAWRLAERDRVEEAS